MTKIKSNNKTTKAKACKGTTTICKSSFKNKKVGREWGENDPLKKKGLTYDSLTP